MSATTTAVAKAVSTTPSNPPSKCATSSLPLTEDLIQQLRQALAQAHKRIAELERKDDSPKSTRDVNTAISSLPSTGGVNKARTLSSLPLKSELEVLLVFLREVMTPRALAAGLPLCEKTSHITQSDCITLAKGFDYLSKTASSNEDAVGKFVGKYPVMREMQDRNPVLEEALVLMSVRLANDGKKYAAVRLFGGALLSTFDLITDIYMIWTYYATGENAFAIASLISLFTNIIIQLALVYFQYRNHPSKSRIFTEMLYVLFAVKPGVDAYRVVLGAEKEVGALMDPRSEMVVSKCWELFTEAIPGALIQTYAFLVGSNQSNAAIFSLVFSVFTASFTSTGVSFDFDMDKNARVQSPDFYGYVPGEMKKKVKVFASIFFISACQLSAKVLSCALCAVESSMTVVFYLVGEMLLFLAYKLFRRDFTYWIPVYGLGGVVLSICIRIAFKIVTDFTALMQFRNAPDLGGSYWAFTLLSTPVFCFYLASRYLAYMDSEEGKARELTMVLGGTQVYGMVCGLFVVQVTAFVLFLKSINPKYIGTFYRTMSGNEYTMGSFLNHDDDEGKLAIFGDHRHKWRKIEGEVVEWVNLKIPEWNEERPEWWNAQVKATIPDWAVRDEDVLRSIRSEDVVKVVQERRGSILNVA